MPAKPFAVDVTYTIKKLSVSQPPLHCDRLLSVSIATPGRRDEFISRSVLFNAQDMTPKRSKKHFNKHPKLRYGVRIHSWSSNGVVTGVECMFYFTFERERRKVNGCIAKTSSRITVTQVYSSFRPDYYLHQLRDHNPKKWREFDELVDTEEKISFFECKNSFANCVTSHFSLAPSDIYRIQAPIVDVIILHFFVDSSCSTVETFKEFKYVRKDYGALKISNIRQFDLCFRHVSFGLSFWRTAFSVQITRLVVDAVDLQGVTEQVVQTCTR